MRNLIKKHIFKVKNMTGEDSARIIEEDLKKLLGIKEVAANHKTGKIDITYNLKFISYKLLENKLKKLGYPPIKGIYQSLKIGFISFTEKNERSNLKLNSSNYKNNFQGKLL